MSHTVFRQFLFYFREDIKMHDGWLQPKCCSIQQLCIAFLILISRSWLLNMGLQPMNVDVFPYFQSIKNISVAKSLVVV